MVHRAMATEAAMLKISIFIQMSLSLLLYLSLALPENIFSSEIRPSLFAYVTATWTGDLVFGSGATAAAAEGSRVTTRPRCCPQPFAHSATVGILAGANTNVLWVVPNVG